MNQATDPGTVCDQNSSSRIVSDFFGQVVPQPHHETAFHLANVDLRVHAEADSKVT